MFFRGGSQLPGIGLRLETLLKSLYRSIGSRQRGAIAQLGERVVRNDEAVGSIPTSSTNVLSNLQGLHSNFQH
jgi:hypothetical protein